jgi:hypothetical protein
MLQRLEVFHESSERLALERLEYRCVQTILPPLFQHLDRLQGLPSVQRAIALSEYGYVDPDHTLRPLFIKCVQDVLSSVSDRSLLTLVEADLVESKQFHTLIQWIENTSQEFRDEVGRLRAQHRLVSFQEDIRSAMKAMQTAGSCLHIL